MSMGSQEDDHTTTTVVYGEDDDLEVEGDDSMSSGVAVATVTAPLSRSDETRKTTTPLDESRRLFQRLWTDEDEIELLQGFLDYTTHRLLNHHHHHDTTAFYDQIKSKLQLDFNKNQLVEKLRRLKKKYRNVVSKISSCKDYVFKSAHDQLTFDISCKIWSTGAIVSSTPATADVYDDPNPNFTLNLNDHNGNCAPYSKSSEKKLPRPPKRARSGGVKMEEKLSQQQCGQCLGVGASNSSNLVEETVKSCLLPLFKELLNNSPNGLGGMNCNPLSLNFGDISNEGWRKQHILELEVCSKRLELVQDQIKSQLEELKSMRS